MYLSLPPVGQLPSSRRVLYRIEIVVEDSTYRASTTPDSFFFFFSFFFFSFFFLCSIRLKPLKETRFPVAVQAEKRRFFPVNWPISSGKTVFFFGQCFSYFPGMLFVSEHSIQRFHLCFSWCVASIQPQEAT